MVKYIFISVKDVLYIISFFYEFSTHFSIDFTLLIHTSLTPTRCVAQRILILHFVMFQI